MDTGTISREEAAWLAGIIDGEGYLHVGTRGASRGSMRMSRISLEVNSISPFLIRRIGEVWTKLRVRYCYAFGQNSAGNQFLRILCDGQGSLLKILQEIQPYMTAKREEVDLILEFLRWRPTMGYGPASPTGMLIKRYAALHDGLVALHRRRFSLQRLPRRPSQPLDLALLEVKV